MTYKLDKEKLSEHLFSQNLIWTSKTKKSWRTEYIENAFLLKMNNFPDEVLYSLFDSNGKLIAQFDDPPNTWFIEFS